MRSLIVFVTCLRNMWAHARLIENAPYDLFSHGLAGFSLAWLGLGWFGLAWRGFKEQVDLAHIHLQVVHTHL
jgi:hypothetical protein